MTKRIAWVSRTFLQITGLFIMLKRHVPSGGGRITRNVGQRPFHALVRSAASDMKGGLQPFVAVSTNGSNAQLVTFRNGALAVKHLIP